MGARQVTYSDVVARFLYQPLNLVGMADDQLIFKHEDGSVLVAEVCHDCGVHLNFLLADEGDLYDPQKAGDAA